MGLPVGKTPLPGETLTKIKSACALVLGLLAASPDARAAEILTWEECLREASRNNPGLAAAEEAVRKARAQRQASFSDFLPQLSAEAGYTRANSATSLDSAGSGSGVREEFSAGLSARQSLFSGLKSKAGVEKSSAELERVEAELQALRASLGYDLKTAFARLLYSQEQLVLAEAIAARRQENVRLVELRYEAGREHKGSFLRSRAAHRQAVFEVSQARRGLRVAQRELGRALGRPEFSVLQATGTLRAQAPGEPPEWTALAPRTPAFLEARAQARAAEAGVAVARSQFFPELSATGSVSRRGSDWPPDRDRWSAGLSLSFPFFPGGRNIFELRGARAESLKAQAGLRSARDESLLRLEEGFAAFQDAAERTEVQREFLEAAEVRAQIARSQYTSGLLSFEDWDLIENDLIATQKTHLSSLRDAELAQAQWEKAQGRGGMP